MRGTGFRRSNFDFFILFEGDRDATASPAYCISYLQFQWILMIFPSKIAIWCYLGIYTLLSNTPISMCVCAKVIILCQINPVSCPYHSTWAGEISYVPTWLLIVARCRLCDVLRGAYLLWCPMNIVSHNASHVHIQKNYISISKNKARWGRRRTSHWTVWIESMVHCQSSVYHCCIWRFPKMGVPQNHGCQY